MFYAIYEPHKVLPVEVFSSKSKATEFVGNATSVYDVVSYKHLTAKQLRGLPYAQAISFEGAMRNAVFDYRNNQR